MGGKGRCQCQPCPRSVHGGLNAWPPSEWLFRDPASRVNGSGSFAFQLCLPEPGIRQNERSFLVWMGQGAWGLKPRENGWEGGGGQRLGGFLFCDLPDIDCTTAPLHQLTPFLGLLDLQPIFNRRGSLSGPKTLLLLVRPPFISNFRDRPRTPMLKQRFCLPLLLLRQVLLARAAGQSLRAPGRPSRRPGPKTG